MNIYDIVQSYDSSKGTPSTPAIVLTVIIGGAPFEGIGLTLSLAMRNLLSSADAWRERLNEIPDGYLNEQTLALKIALNDF